MVCLMMKKMKKKFWTVIDSDEFERVMNVVTVAVGYGLCLLFIFTMFVTVVGTLSCSFSRSDVVAVWNLCKHFNLI